MAKYRPVDIRVWTDRKFNTLSDDGKLLWLFLLTTPSTLPIPGVIVGGPAGLAEQLGWDVERFTKGLGELFRKGLGIRFDTASRLVWLSKAGAYQRASGENVFKGWAKTWDDVPDCPLKLEIWQSIQASKQFPILFAQLFQEPLQEPFPKGRRQEQEQEQEQEERESDLGATAPRPLSSANPPRKPAGVSPEAAALAAAAVGELNRLAARSFALTGEAVLADAKRLVAKGYTPDQAVAVVQAKYRQWAGDAKMAEQLKPSVLLRPSNFAKYLAEDVAATSVGPRPAPEPVAYDGYEAAS